jgi:hypothetical protein
VGVAAETRAQARRPRFWWWGLLWESAVGACFHAADGAFPRTASRWLDALVWLGFGVLCGATMVYAERMLRRVGLLPAQRGLWGLMRPTGSVTLFTVAVIVDRLIPVGGRYGAIAIPGLVALLVVIGIDEIVAARDVAKWIAARRELRREEAESAHVGPA